MLWLEYYWHKVLKRPYTLARRIDVGRGQPVVFLHGLAATAESWRPTVELLDEQHYRSIGFDLLGFGDSPQPDWLTYSVDDHAKAVIASLRRLRIRKPVILVGHSMGGLVAAHIAHQYPHKVKQLILYQMPVYSEIPTLKVRDFRRQAYLSVFRYLAEHRRVTLWYARVLGRAATKVAGFALSDRTWQPFELSLKNTIMQQHSYENLRSLHMPTDVIYGRYDVLVLRKNMQHFFRPSKHLHFYELDELHRISARAGTLIYQLITGDPAVRQRAFSDKHARLIKLMDADIRQDHPPAARDQRRGYAIAAGVSALVLLICTVAAWPKTVTGWELSLFNTINGGPEGFTLLARALSDAVWLAVFLVAVALLVPRFRRMAWRIAVPAGAAYVLVFIIEAIVARPRPEALLPGEAIIRAAQSGNGYPSGHTATLTAIIVVVWPYISWPVRVLAVLGIVAEGWARIYLGLHFPLDIFGGIAAGVLVARVIRLLPKPTLKPFKLD